MTGNITKIASDHIAQEYKETLKNDRRTRRLGRTSIRKKKTNE
jgi:hypothetical protein